MTEPYLIVPSGLFYSVKRKLTISNDYIRFEKQGLTPDVTTFDKEEVTDYRFGINWISGYALTIGKEYMIFIRNRQNNIIKINFLSLYGFKKKEFQKLYSDILDRIWDHYFRQISDRLINKFRSGQSIDIGNVFISGEGVTIAPSSLFKKHQKIIPWEKVGTYDYQTYFSIYSKDDPAYINKGYSYLNDWNTGILYSVVRSILQDKHLM